MLATACRFTFSKAPKQTLVVLSQNATLSPSCLFFSSRRRHTRFSRDWSSDVCSSDLPCGAPEAFWHPDLDAVDELRALVSGDAPFDLGDTDEYIEGRVAGLDHHLVRKLRRGEFAVQEHVDL